MNNVYIVILGEDYEGYSVKTVHTTRAGAEAAVAKLLVDLEAEGEALGYIARWRKVDDGWRAGADYIDIMEVPVEP